MSTTEKKEKIFPLKEVVVIIALVEIFLISLAVASGILASFGYGFLKNNPYVAAGIADVIALLLVFFWCKKQNHHKAAIGITRARRGEVFLCFFIGVLVFFASGFILSADFWSIVRGKTIFPRILLGLLFMPLTLHGFVGILLTPMTEEILWRGLLLQSLLTKMNKIISVLVSALIFSLVHYGALVSFDYRLILIRFLGGVVLGIIFLRNNNLFGAFTCHGIMNYLAHYYYVIDHSAFK